MQIKIPNHPTLKIDPIGSTDVSDIQKTIGPDLRRFHVRPRAFRYAAAATPWLERQGDEISFGHDRRAPVSVNDPHQPISLCFWHVDEPDEALAVMTRVRHEGLERLVLQAMV